MATHHSDTNDAKLSTIIHDRALFLCASLFPQDIAILRNLPYDLSSAYASSVVHPNSKQNIHIQYDGIDFIPLEELAKKETA